MKKQFLIIAAMVFLLTACTADATRQEVEPDPVDVFAECLEVPDASANGKTLSPEGLIDGHIIPDKKNKVAGFTDRLHPDGIINIVLAEDFYKLKYDKKLIEIFQEFSNTTGLEVLVHPNDDRPENYTLFQHAFFESTHLGFQGGKQYASTGTWVIDNQPWHVKHTLAHIAGLGDESSRPDRDEYIDIDYTNVPDGFGFYEINTDMKVCGEYNYEALVQRQSEDVTTNEQTDAVTDKEGNDLPYVTEFSEQEIAFIKALYQIE